MTTSANVLGNLQANESKPLKLILQEIRKSTGINFVYSDSLLDDVLISSTSDEEVTQGELYEILSRYGLSHKIYGNNTIVIFKEKDVEEETRFEKVFTNQEISETDSSGMIIKPILITNPTPSYPRQASRNGIEGSVRIKFLVDKKGNVKQSEVLATSGNSILDSAAREYVYSLKYSPGQKDGKPHSTWMSMLFRYILEGKDNEIKIDQ